MEQGNRAAALVVTAGLATLIASTAAHAQGAGTLMLRAGVTQIRPNVDSGDLTAPSFVGARVDIQSDTQPSGGLTYMLTDHLSVDLPLELPFKHEIVGDGAIAGVGKIGEVRALPFTVFGQYRFLPPTSAFRPYVGAGLTYVKFYKERSTAALNGLTGGTPANPTLLSIQSKFAPTLQLGATYALNTKWFIDLSLTRTFLKTRTTLSTGQTLDATLNPDSIGLSLGYVF